MSRLDEAFPIHEPEQVGDLARAATSITGDDLRAELERLPGQVVDFGVAYARAMRAHLVAKATLDEVCKAAFLEERETSVALGERPTEALVDARVARRSDVRRARADLVEAEYQREVSRSVCDALRAKREALDALVQLMRQEMPRAPWRGGEGEGPF